MKKKRLDNLDLLKAIGIFMVITLHVPLWQPDFVRFDLPIIYVQYAIRIAMEGVPIFLFVNGFLLFKRTSLDLKKHYLKTLKIVALIIVWSFIYAFCGLALDQEVSSFGLKDVLEVVFTTSNNAKYTGLLWFLQGLTALYILYPMFWYIYKNNMTLYKVLFYVLSFFIVGGTVFKQIEDLLSIVYTNPLIDEMWNYIKILDPFGVEGYLFFFMLGGMVFYYSDKIKEHRMKFSILGIVAWVLSFVFAVVMTHQRNELYDQTFNALSIYIVFMIIGWYAITINYTNSNWLTKIIGSIGQNTMGIYLLHFLLISIMKYCFEIKHMLDLPIYIRLLVVLGVFLVSYLLTLLINKIPYIKKLINI